MPLPGESREDFARNAMQNTGLPLINAMGAQGAADNAKLNEAVRLQLKHVYAEIDHYIHNTDHNANGTPRMPHEWGSMDSFDDMRNSLRVAAAFMDELLWTDDETTYMRHVLAEGMMCAVPEAVIVLAFGTTDHEAIDVMIDQLVPEPNPSTTPETSPT